MKTFKLVSLEILENKNDDLNQHKVDIIDGLIINREDEKNQWIIEAYLNQEYYDFFQQYKNNNKEMVLLAKITKETNQPATLLVNIIDLNKIGSNFNVIFKGTLVDRKRNQIEALLKQLIDQGLQGNELLQKFKEYYHMKTSS